MVLTTHTFEVLIMRAFLEHSAWAMNTPQPYSLFHLCFMVFGILAAALGAWLLARQTENQWFIPILFVCGIILTASEAYKQLFLYYVVNNGTYDWWYFPFQLCSLPMYFCLILPLVRNQRFAAVLLTFMQDFNLLGGIMALAEPSGLFHPYWLLTLHGLIWHILLIFIGLYIGFSRRADESVGGYVKTLPLLFLCCGIAALINVTAKPLGQADMFYISPYYPNNQAIFSAIAGKLGITAGNLIYVFSICVGGFLCHGAFGFLSRRKLIAHCGQIAAKQLKK